MRKQTLSKTDIKRVEAVRQLDRDLVAARGRNVGLTQMHAIAGDIGFQYGLVYARTVDRARAGDFESADKLIDVLIDVAEGETAPQPKPKQQPAPQPKPRQAPKSRATNDNGPDEAGDGLRSDVLPSMQGIPIGPEASRSSSGNMTIVRQSN